MIRNLLWITADQWRWDCIGALGIKPVRTPNIDRLAARSALFENHYVQAAPCGPSRASLHTGLYPWQHGSWFNGAPIRPDAGNWAIELARQGIAPALVGYTHTTLDPQYFAAARTMPRGFEGILPGLLLKAELTVDMADWKAWFAKSAQGRLSGISPEVRIADEGEGYRWGEALYPFELSDTAYIADRSARFIRSRKGQPWALHATFFRPHDPYFVTSELLDGQAEAEDDVVVAPVNGSDALRERLLGGKRNLAPSLRRVRDLRRHYYASVAEMDRGVGLILDTLEEAGADRDTLVILTSDHGDQLGDHGLMNKLAVYDQSFRVPLIIHDPDADLAMAGTVVAEITQGIDLTPTVFDYLLGIATPSTPGRSLRPWLRGEAVSEWRDHALWGYCYQHDAGTGNKKVLRAVRSKSHLYAEFDDMPPLLIDYRDGGEFRWINIAESREGKSVVSLMKAAIDCTRC